MLFSTIIPQSACESSTYGNRHKCNLIIYQDLASAFMSQLCYVPLRLMGCFDQTQDTPVKKPKPAVLLHSFVFLCSVFLSYRSLHHLSLCPLYIPPSLRSLSSLFCLSSFSVSLSWRSTVFEGSEACFLYAADHCRSQEAARPGLQEAAAPTDGPQPSDARHSQRTGGVKNQGHTQTCAAAALGFVTRTPFEPTFIQTSKTRRNESR